MTAALQIAIQYAQGNARGIDLETEPHPMIAIDLDAAEILAANASGAEALGLFPYASFPIALDPMTPALIRLRELVAKGDTGRGDIETLNFWSRGRLRPISCTIARRRGGSEALLLRVADEPARDPAAPETSRALSNNKDRRAPDATPPPVSSPNHGDRETLKGFARQFRENERSAAHTQPLQAVFTSEPSLPADAGPASASRLSAPEGDASGGDARAAQRKALSILDPDHLAKLAHELKTPLSAIAAAAEVMRDERLGAMKNERYRNYAADIHESATHALDVITSLLSESGKPSAPVSRLIALDLNAIVERTVSSVQALAQSRGLNLACDIERSRPHVIANPTALRQTLLNLLTNAIKFTPRNGDVRVVTGYLPDGRVFVVVRDTGCGMNGNNGAATEHHSPGDTHPDISRGNGIGLPLVERLVAEMGAEFEIDSAPGKGTAALIAFGGFGRWTD